VTAARQALKRTMKKAKEAKLSLSLTAMVGLGHIKTAHATLRLL